MTQKLLIALGTFCRDFQHGHVANAGVRASNNKEVREARYGAAKV